jgi:hypothetical protein
MLNSMIDVQQRIAFLERRRSNLRSVANRCRLSVRLGQQLSESDAWQLAHAAIAGAQAQCLTVEIYALRAIAGVGAQNIER